MEEDNEPDEPEPESPLFDPKVGQPVRWQEKEATVIEVRGCSTYVISIDGDEVIADYVELSPGVASDRLTPRAESENLMSEENKPRCPICEGEPQEGIEPFCSADCLSADPRGSNDADLQRRIADFDERDSGAGGPGGMVSSHAGSRLLWYLAGAQDEAARVPVPADGHDNPRGVPAPAVDRQAMALLDRLCNEGAAEVTADDLESLGALVRERLVRVMANTEGMIRWSDYCQAH